ALGQAVQLTRLRGLNLGGDLLTADGCQALANADHLASLRELNLLADQLYAPAVRALAESKPPAGVTALRLHTNPRGRDGVQALVGARFIPSLAELNIAVVGMRAAGARALGNAPFSGLRKLNVSGNEFQKAAFEALASAEWLANLDKLRLTRTGMTRRG